MKRNRFLILILAGCLAFGFILALPAGTVFAGDDSPDTPAGDSSDESSDSPDASSSNEGESQPEAADTSSDSGGSSPDPAPANESPGEEGSGDAPAPSGESGESDAPADDDSIEQSVEDAQPEDSVEQPAEDAQPEESSEPSEDATPDQPIAANDDPPESGGDNPGDGSTGDDGEAGEETGNGVGVPPAPESNDPASGEEEIDLGETVDAARGKNVDLVPLDENGEALPLATIEAGETITGGDPYYDDGTGTWIGYTGIGDTCAAIVDVCNQVATPIQAAVDNAPAGSTIYVEQDTYTEDVVINKTLTLAGLWQGNEDPANRPTLEGSVTISALDVWLNGFIIDATGRANGVMITGDGAIVSNSDISGATGANIMVNGAQDVVINNSDISNSTGGPGISLNNAPGASITYNNIHDNMAIGVDITGTDTSHVISNNNVAGQATAFQEAGAANIDLDSNYIQGAVTGNFTIINPQALPLPLPVPGDHPVPPTAAGGGDGGDTDQDTQGGQGDWYDGIPSGGPAYWTPPGAPDGIWIQIGGMWACYVPELSGWVYWVDEYHQYLRSDYGPSWYIMLNDGTVVPLTIITDFNWELIDGEWHCATELGSGTPDENSPCEVAYLLVDCVLYQYASGAFQWARTNGGEVFVLNDNEEWIAQP